MNSRVVGAAAVIVADQELVREHCRQDLRLIVGQATMPYVVSQIDPVLEPFVERFGGSSSSAIEPSSSWAFEECQTPLPLPTASLSLPAMRISSDLRLAASGLQRADEPSARRPAVRVVLHGFGAGRPDPAGTACHPVKVKLDENLPTELADLLSAGANRRGRAGAWAHAVLFLWLRPGGHSVRRTC